jgi:hypothetical protein
MPIIAPSREFDGAEIASASFGRLLKPGVRTVSFRKDDNKDGVFIVMLPPYRTDAAGRGVSWRLVEVRDKFGLEGMDSFPALRNCPVTYLAGQAKRLFPEYVAVEEPNPGARFGKKYPPIGRLARKVLLNVAYVNNMAAGAHVLVLPQYGGGSEIEGWYAQRQLDGSQRRLLNDPAGAVPIFVQLKKGDSVVGNPWVVRFEAGTQIPLPPQLCDSDYLYNLDEVIDYPSVHDLIDKMRSFVPPHIFSACMTGYAMPDGSAFQPPAAATYHPVPNSSATVPPWMVQQVQAAHVPAAMPAHVPAVAPIQTPAATVPPWLPPQAVPVPAQVHAPQGVQAPPAIPRATVPVGQAFPAATIPMATIPMAAVPAVPSAQPTMSVRGSGLAALDLGPEDVPPEEAVPQQPAAQTANPAAAPAFTAEQALMFLQKNKG